jgi:predicted nucleotidyltransferase
MTALEQNLRLIAAALDRRAVGYALVGGLAVAVRAEPRLTRDADIAVAVPTDAEAEALILALRGDGFEPFAAVEHTLAGRLATIRLARDVDDGAVTDLLFASSGIEGEIVQQATRVEVLPGLELPVATVGHLIVMKVLARDDRSRPADADDLVGLAAVASDSDWAEAERAAHLVVARGFHRGRDLVALVHRQRVEPGW